MIIDFISNANRYKTLGERITKALNYLQTTDLITLEKGTYNIEGDNVFAIVNEYETVHVDAEQMEAHKKYIDVQYVAEGTENIGHSFLQHQTPSTAYDDEKDFMLFAEYPDFYSTLTKGMFAIFYPTDLHMPGVHLHNSCTVKKIVIKIKIDE
jgi:YhcH/YjgK/YiaL family protein